MGPSRIAASVLAVLGLLVAVVALDVRRSADVSRLQDQRTAEARAVDRMGTDLDELLATAGQLRRNVDVLGVVKARSAFPVLAQQTVAQPVATSVALEQVVPPGSRRLFEQAAGFSIDRPPDGPSSRSHLVVTSAISTDVPGSSLWGLDVFVDPVRRVVLRRAFATGAPRATPPVSGLRRIGLGTTVYFPLERRRGMPMPDVIGVSLDLSALGAQLRASLPAGSQVAIRDGGRSIASTDRRALGAPSRAYSFAGRRWVLSAWSPAAGRSALWISVLLGGLTAAALLSTVLWIVLTRLRRASEERQALAERIGDLFEHSPVGLVVTGADYRVREVNPALDALLGHTPGELLGRHIAALVDHRDRDRLLPVAEDLAAGRTATLEGEARLLRADGSPVWTQLTATPQRDAGGTLAGVLLQATNIEQRRVEQALLQRLAERDPLTGALNRRSFDARLERHLAACRASAPRGAVYVVDLDRFKQVNDRYGHGVGDQVLVAVAETLHDCLREADALARIGGDEFAFLLADGTMPEEFEAVASRVRCAVDGLRLSARPGKDDGEHVDLTVSASLGWSPVGDGDEQSLLRAADAAMYVAKQAAQPA